MQGLADFLDDFLGSAELLALALALGGLAWCAGVLRGIPCAGGPAQCAARGRSLVLMLTGAAALAALQLTHVLVKGWIITLAIHRPLFPAYLQTLQFQAGLVHALLAALLAAALVWLRRASDSALRWGAVAITALATLACGAWLTHAASRFEDRAMLMALTALHQGAAVIWAGSVLHLAALWRWRETSARDAIWPLALRRFALLGVLSVGVLIATAVPLAQHLIGSWQGLMATGYGALASAKMALLTSALLLAWLNNRSARHAGTAIWQRTPYVVNVEAVLLLVTILAAVSLSSQPPAVDTQDQQPTLAEVAAVFTPHPPVLHSPSHAQVMVANAADRLGHHPVYDATNAWSNFNHNVAGVILMLTVLLGIAARVPGLEWLRPYWALGFLALALFVLARSDPKTWPLGPEGFWKSTLGNASVLQHRLAGLLTMVLGINEWRVMRGHARDPRLAYVFPTLCVVGGMLLLTHSHSAFELKGEFLIAISHTPMGLFAVLAGCARYLELNLEGRAVRIAGLVNFTCLGAVAAVLMFYRETNL